MLSSKEDLNRLDLILSAQKIVARSWRPRHRPNGGNALTTSLLQKYITALVDSSASILSGVAFCKSASSLMSPKAAASRDFNLPFQSAEYSHR